MGTRILLAALMVVTTAAVVAGLAVLGSPATQRELRLDDRRVEDLVEIEHAVGSYRLKHKSLPNSLRALFAEMPWTTMAADPVTAEPYEYRVLDQNHYELCATFQRASDERVSSWQHGIGRTCFARRAAGLSHE